MPAVLPLLEENYDFSTPLRTIGITLDGIEKDSRMAQLNLFVDREEWHRRRILEETMNTIRGHFRFSEIQRCSPLKGRHLTDFSPGKDYVVHPVGLS